MAAATNPNSPQENAGGAGWTKQIQAAVRSDPRRSTLLMVLVVVLIGLWARLFLNSHPSEASAAHEAVVAAGLAADNPADLPGHRAQTGLSLADWARQPVNRPLSRNFFTVPYDSYPRDPSHPQTDQHTDNTSAKSASSQADQIRERQILVENVREQAANLSLDGIVMGPNPKASVNGELLGVGQNIGATGFRIVSIEPRRIFVELNGVRIDLAMK
jgi:hypothetical protein